VGAEVAVRGIDVARLLREPDHGRILLALGKHGVLPLSLVGYKEPALTYTSTHDQQLWVVYDLFREFSQPTLKHRSLFCCLSSWV
jgi:hypothetical protein